MPSLPSESSPSSSAVPATASRLIYGTVLLSAWANRMWEFAVALLLFDVGESSLLLAAIYGVVVQGAGFLLGPSVGGWVDRSPRLTLARGALVVLNTGVAAKSAVILVMIRWFIDIPCRGDGGGAAIATTATPSANRSSAASLDYSCAAGANATNRLTHRLSHVAKVASRVAWHGGQQEVTSLLVVAVMLLGIVTTLAGSVLKVAVEKDWVVVIAGGDSTRLADMNAMVRRIDLTCKVLAPVAVGAIYQYVEEKGRGETCAVCCVVQHSNTSIPLILCLLLPLLLPQVRLRCLHRRVPVRVERYFRAC